MWDPAPPRTLLVISAKKMPFLLINLKMENPVEKAVNEATADTLTMPDQKLMKMVAELVNKRSD